MTHDHSPAAGKMLRGHPARIATWGTTIIHGDGAVEFDGFEIVGLAASKATKDEVSGFVLTEVLTRAIKRSKKP